MTKLFLEINSDKNNIKDVESFMEKANMGFHLPDDQYARMMIAVTEIAMNAIVHGNKQNSGKKVKVFVEYDESMMKIVVMDEGGGFKINELADPTTEENILDLHGRGIFIARAMVDEFFYQHLEGGGSEFVMIVRKK
ncbi:MAG: ATP-binding protein [Ignavibacteria bacterium]|nr:ATP-binding protein [Ignavibacteria bacterium]